MIYNVPIFKNGDKVARIYVATENVPRKGDYIHFHSDANTSHGSIVKNVVWRFDEHGNLKNIELCIE